MQKLDPKKLPESVTAAYSRARAIAEERFRGRRIVPAPVVVSLPIPEEGESAALHAILVPCGGRARERIARALVAVPAARERGAAALIAAASEANDVALAEMLVWVEGMPEGEKDPGLIARQYLKELQDEAGTLGGAYGAIADQAIGLLDMPEVTRGKL